MNGQIYCITNKINAKTYVGQTRVCLKRRFRTHIGEAIKKNGDTPLYRAIRYYDVENFELSLLEDNIDNINDLNKAEIKWIAQLESFGLKGYNCNTGGDSFIVSEQTKQKISASKINVPLSKEHKIAISLGVSGNKNGFFGKTHSDETITQIKKTLSYKMAGDKNPFFGKTHNDTARQKMSISHKGKPLHPNSAKALENARNGNQHTKGKKLSLSHRLKLADFDIKDVIYIKENPENLSIAALARKLNMKYNAVYRVSVGTSFSDVTL